MKKADQYLQDRLDISRPEDVTVQSLLEIIPSLECTLHEQDYLSNAWNGDAEKNKPFKQPPLLSHVSDCPVCSMSVVSLESKPRLAQNTDVSVPRLKRAKQTLRQVNHGHLGTKHRFPHNIFTGTSQIWHRIPLEGSPKP
jgi:hypothetical protein